MREVGKRINSFGVIFKKIKPVKDLVKNLFNNKTEKKTFRQNTSSKTGDVLGLIRLHLTDVDRRRVTDSGSKGPTGQV